MALLSLPVSAHALDFSIGLEPGVAIPLSPPQSRIYDVGGGQALKARFDITSYLDVGPTASFMLLPASTPDAESGIAWGMGAGLRLKRPLDRATFLGISPWLDADVLYIRTAALHRPGVDAAAGLAAPIGAARTFWVGPFVRYLHIMQPERDGYDHRDAKILTLGVSFEVRSGVARRHESAGPPEIRTVTVTREVLVERVVFLPDRDRDGAPDDVDHCPDASGPTDTAGCPRYENLVVKPGELVLKDKLYFALDQAKLRSISFPVLDEVARALIDNMNFRVRIEGHTDSSGTDGHNRTLSEQRADAVLDYLVAHGVARDRLTSKGLSSSEPIDTNTTADGRENNRRVQFQVQLLIVNDGSAEQ
jgi:outer membrane protein OmpA-like peptidoglycan-associated protein